MHQQTVFWGRLFIKTYRLLILRVAYYFGQINELSNWFFGINDQELVTIASYLDRVDNLEFTSDAENPITITGISALASAVQKLQEPVSLMRRMGFQDQERIHKILVGNCSFALG